LLTFDDTGTGNEKKRLFDSDVKSAKFHKLKTPG
jgi:hypothetical protein